MIINLKRHYGDFNKFDQHIGPIEHDSTTTT